MIIQNSDTNTKVLIIAEIGNNHEGSYTLAEEMIGLAAEAGAEERNIMAMTGHRTTQMVRRYIKEANLFKNNALNKIKI